MVAKTLFCVLALCWPVISSHALLEQVGVIHQTHSHPPHHHHHSQDPAESHDPHESHEHGADNHAFADGEYLRNWTKPLPIKGCDSSMGLIADRVSPFPVLLAAFGPIVLGPSPPGRVPPEYSSRWQFRFRLALPARAPSSLLQ